MVILKGDENTVDFINVNYEQCTKCGICVEVCPNDTLTMAEVGPVIAKDSCMECGHCVAICPVGVLDNKKTPKQETVPVAIPVIDADTASAFLRSRRSIRCYKEDTVERNKIVSLLDVARMAPTAINTQGVSYHVIDDKDVLKNIIEVVVTWMETLITAKNPLGLYFKGYVDRYRQEGKDVILRGAPGLILATIDKAMLPRGRDNARFALTYAELYANTINLGTCWAGIVEACFVAEYKPLLELVTLGHNKVVAGALMVGYPKYKFKRTVSRKALNIAWQ